MRGRVKWFSQEKGFGFITDEKSTDRHFFVRDVVGDEIPPIGSVVEFEQAEGKKGPRAQTVRLVVKAELHSLESSVSQLRGHSDDRVSCGSCGKKMVPRIITQRGEIQRSVCPFCGGTYKNFGFPWGWAISIVGAGWLFYSAYQWVKGLFH